MQHRLRGLAAMGEKRGLGARGLPVPPAQVVDIAREVVRQVEPEELVVFEAVAESWRSGDLVGRRNQREPGAAVGFGIEAVLISQLVFPIITGALGQVLGTSLTERVHFGRRPARRSAADDGHSETKGDEVALTAGQLRAVHDICQRDAAKLGMAASKASLLADAVVGALSATPGRAGQ
jgi:hypothetical protein